MPMPGPLASQPGQPGGGGDEEIEGNVELILYGTMTLYQRFPPRLPSLPASFVKDEPAAPKAP
jgi:hypothetical protein